MTKARIGIALAAAVVASVVLAAGGPQHVPLADQAIRAQVQ